MTIGAYGALLDGIRGVHWPARRPVISGPAGSHHSKMRGTSAEFTEFRLYRQGDDTRRIDWKLLARSDRAYIRLATDRALLPTTLVVDASASMAFPLATRAKWQLAQELTVALAAVVHGDSDPVGVALYDDAGIARGVPARTRRGVVGEIARLLDDIDPDGTADLAPLIGPLKTPRIVILTDLLGDADALLAAASVHVVAGGEAYVVHIIAAEELDPPRRTMLAADSEAPGDQRLLIDGTRREYDRAFAEWRSETSRRWRAAGATFHTVVTGEDIPHAVRRVVDPGVIAGGRA